jgi:glycosyltransferase involved in cell wall biosynthesis
MISYHFPPCASIGMQRTLRFARHLPLFGWRSVVLTVRPHDYIGEPIEQDWQHRMPLATTIHRARVLRPLEAALKIRSLWQRLGYRRTAASPPQLRTPPQEAATATPSWVQRWIDPWFTTPDAQIGWLPFALLRGLWALWTERGDMLYSSGPPYTAHLIGLGLKWLTGRPWVVDFRDPWSRRPWDTDTMRQGLRYRIQVWLEQLVVHHADTVVSNTERMGQDFRSRYSALPADKFIVITNGYDIENFSSATSDDIPPSDVFTLTHAGALYGRRDPRPLIQAIAWLRDRGLITPGTFRLQLVGKLAAPWHVESMLAALNLAEYVALVPPVPHAESIKYLQRSHVLLLLQPDAPLQVPGKLFEYVYLQKPILALAGEGATADLVQQHALGKVVAPEDGAAIAAAVASFYQDFRRGGRWAQQNDSALHRFHGQSLAKQLADVFRTLQA